MSVRQSTTLGLVYGVRAVLILGWVAVWATMISLVAVFVVSFWMWIITSLPV